MKKDIKWHKYEDVLDKQINSDFLHNVVMKGAMSATLLGDQLEELGLEEGDSEFDQMGGEAPLIIPIPVPIPADLAEEITLINNFDCWMAHTNFNITTNVKEQINKIDGVEILKIYSRYRFFIGVGSMFSIGDVRVKIEQALTGKHSLE